MADEKVKTAVVAGKSAAGNSHLDEIISTLQKGYKANRLGKSNRQIRIDHTAMIPNPKPIWAYKDDGKGNRIPQLLFRAGWYLSLEEKNIADELMKDPEIKALNQRIWKAMKDQGVTVEKESAEAESAKVVA